MYQAETRPLIVSHTQQII